MTDRAEGQASWASVIRKWEEHDPDGLRMAAESVAEVMQHPGMEVLRKLNNDKIASLFQQAQGSPVLEHLEYVRLHSEIRGLKLAQDAAGVLISVNAEMQKQRQTSVEQTQSSSGMSEGEKHGRFRRNRTRTAD